MTVRVLVADDHPVYREGLRAVLAGADGIEVAGEATTGEEAVQSVAAGGCDVVLMDVQMPGLSGIEATRQIADRAAVVVLTMSEDHATLTAAMAAGARGYLVKGQHPRRSSTRSGLPLVARASSEQRWRTWSAHSSPGVAPRRSPS
jgi:DNA-binding NarL/FixJ family response regulator